MTGEGHIMRRAVLAAGLAAPGLARAEARGGEPGALALPVHQDDALAPGLRRGLLLRWGDRVTADAPAWTPLAPTADAAAAQFGWDARVLGLLPPPLPATDGIARALLAIAHPIVTEAMALPRALRGGPEEPAIAAAMQGVSLVNLERRGTGWDMVDGGFQNRRLGHETLCRLSGGGAIRGLLGVVGGCATPWGRLLLAEGDPAFWQARLGPALGEAENFGWVAELDPFAPRAVPIKRRALGRFAHGDVAATTARDGRAVVYLTDRRPGGFLFRFLSAGPAGAEDALDTGTLAVARLAGARLDWLPLPADAAPIAAAGPAGGTPFDTPSGLGQDPARPRLLLACHGSADRPAGHVIEITSEDAGAPDAQALLLFAAGDPAGPAARYGQAGLPAGAAWPENPDTVTVDGRGRAFIGTNRGGRVGALADGLFGCDLDGPGRGVPRALYGAARAGALGGAALLPGGEALVAAVRHPGAEPGASFEKPATRWPEFQPGVPPRSALVLLTQGTGGAIGG